MSPSLNIRSSPTKYNGAITTSLSTSPYVTQTEFSTTISNTIKYPLANFDDTHAKQDANFNETIVYQDAKYYAIFEKQLHTLSLLTKEDSTKFSIKLDN